MKKINAIVEALEQEYHAIDSSNEEREVMRVQRLLDEAVANRNKKIELKRMVLTKLEYWNEVKEKYLELPEVEPTPEVPDEEEAENA